MPAGPDLNPNRQFFGANVQPDLQFEIRGAAAEFHLERNPLHEALAPDHALLVQKDDTRIAIYGSSRDQIGIMGHSEKVAGVMGLSDKEIGVYGDGGLNGVCGNSDRGDGVVGTGKRGVVGDSVTFQGVFGHSRDNGGVVGVSEKSHGIWGFSHDSNSAGVIGINQNGGVGVVCEGGTGVGLHASGETLAGYFKGDLEVTGDIRLSHADCAEDFDIAEQAVVEAGTVVILGDEGGLYQCHEPYDKRVAGVISGAGNYKPGIILDKQSTNGNRQPVALLGKVYCKVDAQYGAVETGDLLTTSATEGHAMKVLEPLRAFGTVIGKALRPLKEGRGLVPILVTLQ